MDRKIIGVYLVFCTFFFLALAAFLVYRVSTTWGANAREARTDFDGLAREAASLYLAAGDFASSSFRTPMKAAIEREPRLLAMVVYSRDTGVRYAWLRDRSLLPDLGAPPWQGSPAYATLPWGTRLYRLPFAPGQTSDLAIDGLYTVVGGRDAFPILKEAFVVLFCFFVLTALVLLVAPSFAPAGPRRYESDRGAPGPRPASRAAGAQSPELFNPQTGLGWKEHLDQRLRFELERAASSDQDLTLVVMAVDPGSEDRDGEAASAIRRAFPYRDLSFENGPGCFAIILPDHDIERSTESLRRLRRALPPGLSMCSGLSARNGRLVDGGTLLAEAQSGLEKARGEGRGRVVAFRADPERYRGVMADRG